MRKQFEGELDPIQTTIGEWFYWMPVSNNNNRTHRKILVPIDRSIKGTEAVLGVVQELLEPEGVGILLHVISPAATKTVGTGFMSGSQVEKHERARAMWYLNYFANRLSEGPGKWRCEVVVSDSVAEGIADTAIQEEVDLIAMYTHDRKGLAKLIKGSITEKVKQCAPTEVRVVRPRELAVR